MAFSYHPPTRTVCKTCEDLLKKDTNPIISTTEGRASAANGYPCHDWYNFVLGFTPSFPEYVLKREAISEKDLVVDPFNGSGTTQVVCKLKKIPSIGIDANDFMQYASSQKLKWELDPLKLREYEFRILESFSCIAASINWGDEEFLNDYADRLRPPYLDARYISVKPLIKIDLLKTAIETIIKEEDYKQFVLFILSSILVPVSNVKYGPGFGITKAKDDVDVAKVFENKMEKILIDLSSFTEGQIATPSKSILGDSRKLSEYIEPDSVSLMITSPPYPGDHEYTKHSKLELIFKGFATDLASFRVIKKRMIRGSTTNIYKEDKEKELVADIEGIKEVTSEINARLKEDGATSGFEKLYTRLVWEYFGGMYSTLKECFKVLKSGAKIYLLVSDSHSFKMVHIQTASLLKEVGEKAGFINPEILLWQKKNSTSHQYQLRENILILQKP